MPTGATYPLRARPAPALPVSRLVIGKPVAEAAEVLPRLFNLCREAQSIAARAAFGMPIDAGWADALRTEILREHVVKLCLKWPSLVSVPGVPLPKAWSHRPRVLRHALFGPTGTLPADLQGFQSWLESDHGISPVLAAIADLFAPGEATRNALPLATPDRIFQAMAQENSVASRHAAHPVLSGIEARWGRGPLWSATAVAYDAEHMLDGAQPTLHIELGQAVVTAARGLYAVRATVLNGRVQAFRRVTPTDHLLTAGGALDQTLGSLPQGKAALLGPLVLSVLDPCSPVTLEPPKETADA